MNLFHFSEDRAIQRFEPRPPVAFPDIPPHVWAIDDWHAPIYFLPRDCPRVCFWPLPTTTPEDLDHFWAQATGRMVVAIESGWLEQVRSTVLYRYTLPPDSFVSVEDHGVYVSATAVEPLAIEPLDDLLARILEAGVELRICPSLVPLADSVMQTSLHYSLIRMRNAVGWDRPGGTPSLPK